MAVSQRLIGGKPAYALEVLKEGMMKRVMIVLVLSVLIGGCASRPSEDLPVMDATEKYTCVAHIGCLDRMTNDHICALLRSHGIDPLIEGSVVYGVSVAAEDAERAVGILRKDLNTRRYWIVLHEADGEHTYTIPDDMWEVVRPDVSYKDLLVTKGYDESMDIGILLRSRELKEDLRRFPCVVEIRMLKREYLDCEGELRTGHELMIELAESPERATAGKRLSFQVYDDGREIENLGSSEWRRAASQ